FRRLLDTGSEVDDIKLDFNDLTDMSFFVGSANKQGFIDMDVSVAEYTLHDDNVALEFSWDIVDDEINGAMLLTGTIYDDYAGVEIWIRLSGWDATYGAGFWWNYAGSINSATGDWSALFYYDEDDMPLGDQTINVSVHAKYETNNITYQNVSIVDDTTPSIVGLVDLSLSYPDGVPFETEYVPITVGVNDDYAYWVGGLAGYSTTDMLTVNLYSYYDNQVALMTPMVQFSSGGATYSANITLPTQTTGTYNWTYFVQVWDPLNNKIASVHYWFIQGEITIGTPGFGILAGLFGLAGAVFIIYKKRK
ncbi:MAG: Heimdall-CTERM domain-containing surface protein, partial [Candidatus Heimdallarchaeota archaeon]